MGDRTRNLDKLRTPAAGKLVIQRQAGSGDRERPIAHSQHHGQSRKHTTKFTASAGDRATDHPLTKAAKAKLVSSAKGGHAASRGIGRLHATEARNALRHSGKGGSKEWTRQQNAIEGHATKAVDNLRASRSFSATISAHGDTASRTQATSDLRIERSLTDRVTRALSAYDESRTALEDATTSGGMKSSINTTAVAIMYKDFKDRSKELEAALNAVATTEL